MSEYVYKHRHRFLKPCKCGLTNWSVAKMIGPSGQVKYPWYCRACGWFSNIYEPAHSHLIYTFVIDDSADIECEKCGRHGAELHHWGPRHIFVDDYDRWPVAYLCQACHAEWHQRMTPHMADKRRVDEPF